MLRTFPSAAGFTTSDIFYTDDSGTYFFPTRDFHPPKDIVDGKVELQQFLAAHGGPRGYDLVDRGWCHNYTGLLQHLLP
jgi:hypothetical protein